MSGEQATSGRFDYLFEPTRRATSRGRTARPAIAAVKRYPAAVGINTSLRILRLRALIDHPRTGDSERAAAQRMLDRILTTSAARVSSDTRRYGARYDRIGKHAGLATVAEMIRADIELMRVLASTPAAAGGVALQDPIGDAPTEIAFAVDSPHDFSIVVTINRIPREWGWVSEDGIVSSSPALRALADALAEVMNSYNHDGQDVGARFFGTVRAEGETLVW